MKKRFNLAVSVTEVEDHGTHTRRPHTLVSNLTAGDLKYIAGCIDVGSEGGSPTDAERDAAMALAAEMARVADHHTPALQTSNY